jgi:hypothetical protein
VSAYVWYSLAAAGGDERSVRQMKAVSKVMTRRQLQEATVRAALAVQTRIDRPEFSASTADSWLASH